MHSLANILWDLTSSRDAQKGYPQMMVDYFKVLLNTHGFYRYPAIFNFKLLIKPLGVILFAYCMRF